MDGVEFVYALNLSRCIGCRKCVHACVAGEQPEPRNPEIQYIRVLEMPRGSHRRRARRPPLRPPEVPEQGPLLHAGAVPPVRTTRPA